jgi:hypothetical protein
LVCGLGVVVVLAGGAEVVVVVVGALGDVVVGALVVVVGVVVVGAPAVVVGVVVVGAVVVVVGALVVVVGALVDVVVDPLVEELELPVFLSPLPAPAPLPPPTPQPRRPDAPIAERRWDPDMRAAEVMSADLGVGVAPALVPTPASMIGSGFDSHCLPAGQRSA